MKEDEEDGEVARANHGGSVDRLTTAQGSPHLPLRKVSSAWFVMVIPTSGSRLCFRLFTEEF